MKNLLGLLILIIGLGSPAFAQEESVENDPKKHQSFDQYFGLNVGASGMAMNGGSIFTANLGVTYNFYFSSWLSLNAGFIMHQELYNNQPTGNDRFVPDGNPFCFTIPIGIYFNIPNAEWLYTGINFAFNIPLADMSSSNERDIYSGNDVFYSLPIDIGIDMIRLGKGGSRLLFRVTPTFYKGGTAVPVGIVWQVYNWRIFTPKVEVNVPPVEVNIPPPPIINIQ